MEMNIAQDFSGKKIAILSQFANRHGLIAGTTGTGKTVTLQVLAEQFSRIGVPVFVADIKGDLSGVSRAGTLSAKMKERLDKLKFEEPSWSAAPVMFWDVFGNSGHPVRTTLTELGPTLLSRLMDLNETQGSVLQILFRIADDAGLLLIDLKDIDALLKTVLENLEKFKTQYGHLSSASLGAIQRSLLVLEERGTKNFFGEPALDIQDLIQTSSTGQGYINILAADKLLQFPVVYSTFLLWLLSELFEQLPEVGDLDKPKLVFFFDEAHLLFKDAPKALLEKIELVMRLIRSKGVGIYFVTQSPSDIPESVLGQLSHRVQHALRAFTPSDQKAVKVAAETLRPNPKFSAAETITQLNIGEALISVLDASGSPTIVERGFILPPQGQIGPITADERKAKMDQSPVAGHYEKAIDRESAYEILKARSQQTASEAPSSRENEPNKSALNEILFGSVGPRGGRKPGLVEKVATSTARSIAHSVGRELVRGVLGSLLGKGSGRRR
ncbi:MAG: DUF853 domain-containing protein [Bdellovibrionales bacterium]|nr:DUF853 domain-containing protein [Bdellovibrionales bacterium]